MILTYIDIDVMMFKIV